jgi:hypothetical protein
VFTTQAKAKGGVVEQCSLDLAALRRRCEALLATLDLEIPFDLNEFCNRLGRQLAYPIELVAQSMPAEVPGCSIWLDDRIIIAYEQETSLFHQQYIVFHELGHVLFRHDVFQTLEVLPLRLELGAEAIRSALARSGYLAQPEQEAEIFASLLLKRVTPAPIININYRPDDPRVRQIENFIAGLP